MGPCWNAGDVQTRPGWRWSVRREQGVFAPSRVLTDVIQSDSEYSMKLENSENSWRRVPLGVGLEGL